MNSYERLQVNQMTKKSKSVHQQIVNDLEARLKKKPYVQYIETNLKYEKGEYDILTYQDGKYVYYEVKSNDTDKGFTKAQKQLLRGTKRRQYMNHPFYGVYYTPTYIKRIAKDGVGKYIQHTQRLYNMFNSFKKYYRC